MNTKTSKSSAAERFGQRLGKAWKHYVRRERRIVNWFVVKGLPTRGAIAAFWIIKLTVLAVLLYVAFWLTLLVAFVMAIAYGASNANSDEEIPQTEWRDGHAGYGLYTSDGYRVDPHDSEE